MNAFMIAHDFNRYNSHYSNTESKYWNKLSGYIPTIFSRTSLSGNIHRIKVRFTSTSLLSMLPHLIHINITWNNNKIIMDLICGSWWNRSLYGACKRRQELLCVNKHPVSPVLLPGLWSAHTCTHSIRFHVQLLILLILNVGTFAR